MIYEIKYNGLKERQEKISESEAKGLRMLSDTFDNPDWKHGDIQIGTMIFTNEKEPEIIMPVSRDLAKEIDDIKASLIKANIPL